MPMQRKLKPRRTKEFVLSVRNERPIRCTDDERKRKKLFAKIIK